MALKETVKRRLSLWTCTPSIAIEDAANASWSDHLHGGTASCKLRWCLNNKRCVMGAGVLQMACCIQAITDWLSMSMGGTWFHQLLCYATLQERACKEQKVWACLKQTCEMSPAHCWSKVYPIWWVTLAQPALFGMCNRSSMLPTAMLTRRTWDMTKQLATRSSENLSGTPPDAWDAKWKSTMSSMRSACMPIFFCPWWSRRSVS